MSNWFIEVETWRFYRLRSEKFVRFSFVGLFLLRLLAYFAPVQAPDFSALSYAELFDPEEFEVILHKVFDGSSTFFILEAALLFVASMFALTYALTFILEETIYLPEGETDELARRLKQNLENLRTRIHLSRLIRQSMAQQATAIPFDPDDWPDTEAPEFMSSFPYLQEPSGSLAEDWSALGLAAKYKGPVQASLAILLPAIPKILLFFLVLLLVSSVSVLLMGIPLLYFAGAYLLVPFYFVEKQKWSPAFQESKIDSYGFKIFILSKYFVFNLLFLLAQNIAVVSFASETISLYLVESLIFSLKCLVYGRFLGLIYLTIAKRERHTIADSQMTSGL